MHPEEDSSYSMWLSDISGSCLQGNTVAEAVENIKDGLGLYYEEAEEGNLILPVPSVPDKVSLAPDEFVVMVEFPPSEYFKTRSTKAAKKTLSIPAWLNSSTSLLCCNRHWWNGSTQG